MNAPAADGLLHFAGEALSARHAWVEGALDSAWRAVNEMLWLLPDRRRYLLKFYQEWGYSPEWVLAQPPESVPESVKIPGSGKIPESVKIPGSGKIPESIKTPWGIIPFPQEGNVIPDADHNLILQQLARTHPEYFQ